MAGCLLLLQSSQLLADDGPAKKRTLPPVADSISQDVTVDDQYAAATLALRWRALKGQLLPVVFEPAVLTSASYPTGAVRLVHAPVNGRRAQQLVAEADGTFDVRFQYQIQTCKRDLDTGFPLVVQPALANEVRLTIVGFDVDVFADTAVHTQRELVGSNTVATLRLAPATDTFIGWRPRLRDAKQETTLFYAELSQLFVPAAE
jgi:hypothetical protein